MSVKQFMTTDGRAFILSRRSQDKSILALGRDPDAATLDRFEVPRRLIDIGKPGNR